MEREREREGVQAGESTRYGMLDAGLCASLSFSRNKMDAHFSVTVMLLMHENFEAV